MNPTTERLGRNDLDDMRQQLQRGVDNPTYSPPNMLVPRWKLSALLAEVDEARGLVLGICGAMFTRTKVSGRFIPCDLEPGHEGEHSKQLHGFDGEPSGFRAYDGPDGIRSIRDEPDEKAYSSVSGAGGGHSPVAGVPITPGTMGDMAPGSVSVTVRTRKPIAFGDIRVGDVVERERGDTDGVLSTDRLTVSELIRAPRPGVKTGRTTLNNSGPWNWYLVERPSSSAAPVTEVPTSALERLHRKMRDYRHMVEVGSALDEFFDAAEWRDHA